MLERYERQNRLRNKARKNQLGALLQQPDPRLYEQAIKRRQEADFRKRVKKIEAQVPETQPSLEDAATKELRMPAGGTETEQGIIKNTAQRTLSGLLGGGGKILEALDAATKTSVSAISHLGTANLPFTDKNAFELFQTSPLKNEMRPLQIDALNKLGKSMRNQGITAGDYLGASPNIEENNKRSQKILNAYDKSDIGVYENVNDTIEAGLNAIGVSTVDDRGFLDDLFTVFTPYGQATQLGDLLTPTNESTSVAAVNAKLATEAAQKGEPIPQGLTKIPEMSKKLGLELTYDPLNFAEIGYIAKVAGKTKALFKANQPLGLRSKATVAREGQIISKQQIGAATSANIATDDNLLYRPVLLNPDEASGVITYETIGRYVDSVDLPTRSGFVVGSEVSDARLGYRRQELIDMYENLFAEVSTAKYFDQAKVRKQSKLNPQAEAVTAFNGKIRNIEESEKFLKQLNNLLVNDEVISKVSRGIEDDFTNVRYGPKSPRSNFDKASDIDVNAKNLYETPTAANILTGLGVSGKIAGKEIPGLAAFRKGFFSFISPRSKIAGDVFTNPTSSPSEFVEGAHQVWLQQTAAIPDLVEKAPGLAELKRIGSPFEYNAVTGITKIGGIELTPELFRAAKLKVPTLTDDGQMILPTSDFFAKFFTSKGDQQYWQLLNAVGNSGIDNVGDAMLTPVGKWVKKYQKIIDERMEEVFARNVTGYDRAAFIPALRGETYVGRIAAQLIGDGDKAEKALLSGSQFDLTKARAVSDQEIQNFIKEGGRYVNDPYDILRNILFKTYNDQFTEELSQRALNITAFKFDASGQFAGRKMIDDTVNDIQNKITNPQADVFIGKDYNTLINNFPELTEQVNAAEILTGREKQMAFASINKNINKLKKDVNSVYSQRIKQIEEVAKDTAERKNQYASFVKMTSNDTFFQDRTINRKTREKIAKAFGISKVENLESELTKALKDYKLTKGMIVGADGVLKFSERLGNTMKGIYANVDLAAPLLQGQFILARDPASWAAGTKLMVEALQDEKVYYQFIADHSETVQKLINGSVPMGSRTSDFFYLFQKGGKDIEAGSRIARGLGKITGKGYQTKADIPIYASTKKLKGQVGKKLSGTYSDPLDAYKILTYEALEPLAKTADEIEDLNHFIRASTGSMDLGAMGVGQTQQRIENTLAFFSPRLFRGITALSADVLRGGLRGSLAREAWGKLGMAQIILMKEFSDITGGELSLDPSSGNFASVKLPSGETIGFSQTLTPIFRMLAETAEIAMDDPSAFPKFVTQPRASAVEGKGKSPIYNPYTRTLRSKSSVLGGSVWDIATGEDYFGYDITLTETLKKLAVPVPFSIQSSIVDDVNRAAREPDLVLPLVGELDFYWLQLLNPLGIKEYPQSNWDYLYNTRDEVAARRFPSGTDKLTQWNDLSELQKAGLLNPPSEILENLSEGERNQIQKDSTLLKQVAEKVYANVTSPTTPEFMEPYWDNYNKITQKYKFQIEELTEELKQGNLSSSPLQYESAMRIYKRKRSEILDKKYTDVDEIFSKDVESYLDSQKEKTVENSMKYYVDLFQEKVFDNPDFDLANGEFDYQAMKLADKLFLQNDLNGNKELYDQIVSLRFQKKDLNDFEAEVVLGTHIFGGKYFEGADKATLAQYPDVERNYYDTYQKASNDFKRVLRDENPRLAEFISVRNQVRKNLRMNDPYLDAWVYRSGYDNKLLSDAWLINGQQNPSELYSWRDVAMPVDWSYLKRNEKTAFPEYY